MSVGSLFQRKGAVKLKDLLVWFVVSCSCGFESDPFSGRFLMLSTCSASLTLCPYTEYSIGLARRLPIFNPG